MPGRLFLTSSNAQIAAFFDCELGADEEEERYNIAPGQNVIAYLKEGLLKMRWGLIPVGRVNARGRPVMETLINIRSETAFAKKAFEGTKRCIVPANGWYEWTGKARRKTAWRIRPNEDGLLGFAALYDVWVAPGGQELFQLATLTTVPSKDVDDIHHRMGALLRRDQFETWLNAGNDEAAGLLKPYPDGRLTVEEAVGVDWNGA